MTTVAPTQALVQSREPFTGRVVFEAPVTPPDEVPRVVERARVAQRDWSRRSHTDRLAVAQRFADLARERLPQLAQRITEETGKPRWESTGEAKLIPAKVDAMVKAHDTRLAANPILVGTATGQTAYRPLGVVAVLGPFNFPAHLPNGQIVPALLAGNAVVFKPSEFTPGTADLLATCWADAGLPRDVLQVIHGDHNTGQALVDAHINALFFTGSDTAGRAIHRALAGRPDVLLALEMGGNNPIVAHRVDDPQRAAELIAVSAFVTAGQRCTCARRLIFTDDTEADRILETLLELTRSLRVGPPEVKPEPFMGPVIHAAAAQRVLDAQAQWISRGAKPLLEARPLHGRTALLSPGILDTTSVPHDPEYDDAEIFGPLLRVIRTRSLQDTIEEANRTRFGLAASLLSDDPEAFGIFQRDAHAGLLNHNLPTTGASGLLPFGGLGDSGNHRPMGFHAVDHCVTPVAVVDASEMQPTNMPLRLSP
ncbi:MAG: succinylglutamate-semialdehyde dehydrogenase [Planctomycetota bacterium]